MNRKLQIIIFLLVFFVLNNEKSTAQIQCPTDLIYDYKMKTDEVFRKNQLELESQIKDIVQNQKENEANSFLQTSVYNIPVVVHVIHKGEAIGTGTNISDAQITGAIQGLNSRFRNSNATGIDMELNFQLAVRDSAGNVSTGINRVNGTVVPNYGTGGINNVFYSTCGNEQALKDLSRWPIKDYLNIWVVYRICQGNISGIATLQTGSKYDGICIVYNLMTQSNITLSHEVGHMFNLLHTFQGDGGSVTTVTTRYCPPDTCCVDQGDRVCDTPPHKQNDTDAVNPCTLAGVWANSRYNIMSYNWSTLPSVINTTNVRFTQGQKDRGRAAMLATSFQPYVFSNGLIPVTLRDAGIETVVYPLKTMYTSICTFPNNLTPVIKLKNYGTNTLTSVTIKYKLDAGTLNTFLWSGSLLTDSFVNITLPSVATSQGFHTFLAYTISPNGFSDGYGLNDSANCTFNYKAPPVFSLASSISNVTTWGGNNGSASVTVIPKIEIKEDWEGTTDWNIENGSERNRWMIGSATSNGGTKSIYISKDGITNTYDTFTSSITHVYKDFYFPIGATNIKIKFDWKGMGQFFSGFGTVDGLKVYLVSTDKPVTTLIEIAAPFIGTYCLQPSFRTDSIMGLDSIAGTAKKLVFSWRNNLYLGTQSPTAIDNIIVSYNIPTVSTYTYSWNTNPVQTNATAVGLIASNYTATVTNNNGCVASIACNVAQPLPVKFISFSGFANGNDAILNWQTASEINNKGFEMESSIDNINWDNIGFVNGFGNSNTIRLYSFTNPNTFLQNNDIYFRLKQIDFDNTFDFSNTIKLNKYQIATPNISVYPNPTAGKIMIDIPQFIPNSSYTLAIFNSFGEQVFSKMLVAPKTEITTNLKSGIYFYQISHENNQINSGKLLVE